MLIIGYLILNNIYIQSDQLIIMKLNRHLLGILVCTFFSVQPHAQEKDDVNTPLHLLPANYPTPYKAPDKVLVKGVLDRIFNYINQTTTGDKSYVRYVKDRHEFIAQWAGVFRDKLNKGEMTLNAEFPLRQPVAPHALDDGGAVAASMIKAEMLGHATGLKGQINHYLEYVSQKEFRFPDKTIARNRPLNNTLWLDDLYMALPALAQMSKYTNNKAYLDDAIFQLESYSSKMFVPAKGLFMHGWVQGMQTHPAFHWARANGWALLTLTELLDALPVNHPKRNFVLNLFRQHVEGLVKLQDGTGFWHQLLDRSDSYLETSATAIYTYCIAKACNEGWLDKLVYAPVVALGWNAAASKVNAAGQVEGTCVGTGMAFDPAFYYHRPVSKFAAHGYGPLIYAASEVFRLLDKGEFKINDSALIFYPLEKN